MVNTMTVGRRANGARRALAALLIFHCMAIALFVNGYLLTRVHVPNKSTYTEPTCHRPYKKLIWVVIDALRYDFVVADGRYPCGGRHQQCTHQGHMPSVTVLFQTHPTAAKAFRYVADAPTTTTQRLKAMVGGGFPTFFDVSNAFSASAMAEDSLVDQMAAAGWKLAFMGDTTWNNLFPTQFNLSLPFPCFNVKDLDTVDDGIWQNLIPALKQPQQWDALVVHYLGVDHAGHSHGVDSQRMAEKLRQMDAHVAAIVAELKAGAGPGGPYEDALLLLAGDHGQTLGGDHGGGSPEEVDSVLVAVDVGHLRRADTEGEGIEERGERDVHEHGGTESACRASCTCGDDANQCVDDLVQIDLVPTLAAMLDLPIPFANMGMLAPELWSLAASRCARSVAEVPDALARATGANAAQVHAYLNAYAGQLAARFPESALKRLNREFEALPRGQAECSGGAAADCGAAAHLEFLSKAGDVARGVWTQFNELSMTAGLAVFLAALVWHSALAWRSAAPPLGNLKETAVACVPWVGVLAQSAGIFSFFYLLSEGRMVGYILVGATAVITSIRISAAPTAARQLRLLRLGTIAVGCNLALGAFGTASHSGYGFWQRLTVHDPQDALSQGEAAITQPGMQGTLWETLQIGVFGPWARLASHLFAYSVPTLALYQLAAGGAMRHAWTTQRLLLGGAFLLLAAHQGGEYVVAQGWAPQGFSLGSLLASSSPLAGLLPSSVLSNALQLPCRLLLPRLQLAASLASFLIAALRFRAVSAAETAIAVAGSLTPLILLLSPTLIPLLGLLCVLQAAALTSLVAEGPRCQGESSRTAACAAAALFAAMQTQAFFVSGHLCEFAGVHYTAGFVGYEDFHLLRSAMLIGVDSFGGMVLILLGLVPAAAAINIRGSGGQRKQQPNKVRMITQMRLNSKPLVPMLLLFGLSRAASCFCAMLSAGIQRRHLYAWALFAPKFVFEVFFLVLTDVVLIFVASGVPQRFTDLQIKAL